MPGIGTLRVNMMKRVNESKVTFAKHILCECECGFDGRKRKSRQKGNSVKVSGSLKTTKAFCVRKRLYLES